MISTGPKEAKANDEGGPRRKSYRDFWNLVFFQKEKCQFFDGYICMFKVQRLKKEDFPFPFHQHIEGLDCDGMCRKYKPRGGK